MKKNFWGYLNVFGTVLMMGLFFWGAWRRDPWMMATAFGTLVVVNLMDIRDHVSAPSMTLVLNTPEPETEVKESGKHR